MWNFATLPAAKSAMHGSCGTLACSAAVRAASVCTPCRRCLGGRNPPSCSPMCSDAGRCHGIGQLKVRRVRAVWDGKDICVFRSGRVVPARRRGGWRNCQRRRSMASCGSRVGSLMSFPASMRTRARPSMSTTGSALYLIFRVMPDEAGARHLRATLQPFVGLSAKAMGLQSVSKLHLRSCRTETPSRPRGEGRWRGLMLHLADALMSPGRSDACCWLQITARRAQWCVTVPARAATPGVSAALEVRTRDVVEVRLSTGFSDARANTAGRQLVTYTYRDVTPPATVASFLRVRRDP